MLDMQINFSAQAETENIHSEQLPLCSGKSLEALTFALGANERFGGLALELVKGVLCEQGRYLRRSDCQSPTLVSITSIAERASKRLQSQAGGVSLNGLPSIQRITHAEVFL
ncbi:hypothetical protein [Pseudovibrio sp. Tun.PSC04-5.I4]|uniref:hypothetical protein n=1 Tax=Pseudovibrio sp. Tun.PSC04-5.I4 TaxID=1798213 RepID=UPI00088E23F6|nr:hypothetical protein [Pseudovibrio sp. Tun.PSC04-5.I4]SDQ92716.1 hypothetical protein SAMN04515695_1925 [Pseudovibrio sp. Tun.PSC04-5.I4]